MQTLLHVYCTAGRSLRESIAKDLRLARFDIEVVKVLQPGRAPGWTKLRSMRPDRRGSLNLEWDAPARVLQCRIVNRGTGRPHLVVGDFLDFLLKHYAHRVRSIVILPGVTR